MSTEDDKIIEQLKKDFLDEVSYYLDQIEESYLKLENADNKAEEIKTIFRLAHSIKGSGSALGYKDFAEFAHLVEDCLSLLRDHPHLLEPGMISVFLRTTDTLKEKLEMIRTGNSQPWVTEPLKTELLQIVSKLEKNSVSAPSSSSDIVRKSIWHTDQVNFDDPRFTPNATSIDNRKSEPATELWVKLSETTQQHLDRHNKETSVKIETPQSPTRPSPAIAPAIPEVPPTANPGSSTPPKEGRTAHNSGSSSVKIDIDRIDSILNIVGELVVIKSQLMNQTEKYPADLKLLSVVELMDNTIRNLQDKTLTMRMTPLKTTFLKLQRAVRDLSFKLGKNVEFQMTGEDTEIDRNMVELLADPLLHICRNSLDHGIESPEKRKATNKHEKGFIHIFARQVGGRVMITITDDGQGLNFERIIMKAKENGILSPSQDRGTLSDKEIMNIIFLPGFSTADKVTDVSGRGVGMDVVRANIEKLRGTIEIDTKPGIGTTFTISLPVTTAITDGMLVSIGARHYIIPMNTIHELINTQNCSITRLHNKLRVLNHRGHFLPILDLREILTSEATDDSAEDVVVIVELGTRYIALRLEKILGQVQVVLKSLGSTFRSSRGLSGATILGDGKVALVLDPVGLAEYAIDAEKKIENLKKRESAA